MGGELKPKNTLTLEEATKLLYSKKYHQEKAKIMKPINEFMKLLEKRTTNEVNEALKIVQNYVNILIAILVFITIFFIILFFINRKKIPNLYKFKDGLLDFFKYINNEKDYSGIIDIKTNDEIGLMTKVVNENIIKTKKSIELDRNVINETIQILQEFEKGDFSKRIKTSSNSITINRLTELLNKMAENLEAKFNDILNTLEEYSLLNYTNRVDTKDLKAQILNLALGINHLADSMSNLLKESNELANTHAGDLKKYSNELLRNIDVLNTNTNETATALEQTAAAIEQMNSNTTSNLENVIKMTQNASVLNEATNKGKDLAFKTSEAMGDINEQVSSINEAITVIDQIAFQTNILSLNAAVEAATAGEAGKGFAVVAQEVRNLASRSAEAAKEIKSLVENATLKAHDGKDIAGTMSEDYNTLNNIIANNISLMKNVELANKEQSLGISQINDSINSLDKKTQENASVASHTYEIAKKTDIIAEEISKSTKKSKY